MILDMEGLGTNALSLTCPSLAFIQSIHQTFFLESRIASQIVDGRRG